MSFLCQCFKLKRVFQMRKLILLNLIAVLLTLREGEMWEVATALWTLVLLAGTIWLVRHFVRPDTAWGYRVIVFIAWFLGFFGAVLLPVDIATAYGAGGPDGAVKGLWLFVYWTTFVLTWVVCPIAQEFFGSGYFTPKARLRDSLRANLKFYIVAVEMYMMVSASQVDKQLPSTAPPQHTHTHKHALSPASIRVRPSRMRSSSSALPSCGIFRSG